MSRTRVRRRRVVVLGSAAVMVALWAGPVANAMGGSSEPPVVAHRYVIRAGDTLWSIAERTGRGGDPRELVDAIARVNGVEPGAIVPGQTLVIPRD